MLIDKQTPVVLLLVLLLVLLCFNFLLEFLLADLPRVEKNVIIVFVQETDTFDPFRVICHIWRSMLLESVGLLFIPIIILQTLVRFVKYYSNIVRIFFSPHGVGLLGCWIVADCVPRLVVWLS